MEPQLTSRLMMVRPAGFTFNPETARTNGFQRPVEGQVHATVLGRARQEFDHMVEVLETAGVSVHVFEDSEHPHTPDAVFPNNWISFHACGRALLYPMEAPSRRAEVRPEWIEAAGRPLNTRWNALDLTGLHETGAFLEGTGSLVLDRAHRVAYACMSPRTTAAGLDVFAREMDYEVQRFHAFDRGGQAIYHTNVLMGIGADYALVCLEAIADPSEREAVRSRLEGTGHEVLGLTVEQMESFAGNCLAVASQDGEPLTVMSTRAAQSLSATQVKALETYGRLVHAPLPTIEAHGGGSARCMLAEIHAPPSASD